jgi:hypothetical protein
LPSCEPNSSDPSSASAGDEVTGPPVVYVHQIDGLADGST